MAVDPLSSHQNHKKLVKIGPRLAKLWIRVWFKSSDLDILCYTNEDTCKLYYTIIDFNEVDIRIYLQFTEAARPR